RRMAGMLVDRRWRTARHHPLPDRPCRQHGGGRHRVLPPCAQPPAQAHAAGAGDLPCDRCAGHQSLPMSAASHTRPRLWRRRHPASPLRPGQHGASALVFLVSLAVTLGALLAAVDLARIQLAQGRLQSALDSAVQSAARRFGTAANAAWESEIRAWMQANHREPFTLSVQPGRDRLAATASSRLSLFSAGLLPLDATTRTVRAASSTFLSNSRRLEVAVALDV